MDDGRGEEFGSGDVDVVPLGITDG